MKTTRQHLPRTVLTVLALGLIPCQVWAQHLVSALPRTEKPVSAKQMQRSLKEVLQEVQHRYRVDFAYQESVVAQKQVARSPAGPADVEQLLTQVLDPLGLTFQKIDKGFYAILPGSGRSTGQGAGALASTALALPARLAAASFEALAVSITGRVTGTGGEPLPGVTVVVKGTTVGTTTDTDGRYTLQAPDGGGLLVFSFIGTVPKEVPYTRAGTINVTLADDTKALEEIVVVGYGTMKKSDLTGAVSSIGAQVIQSRPITTAAEAIQGRAPGVQVMNNSGAPGGNVSIRIRGSNSISATNEPLYVVDGIIGVGGLQYINPNDIESIEVLKDASATSIYGSRGANGVVLISTKRGKAGKAQVSYDSYYGWSVMSRKIDMLNASEYMQMENEAYANSGLVPQFTQEQINNPQYDTDWQKEATRTAFRQNHQLGVYGGSDQSRYAISAGYLNDEGIMLESKLQRGNLRLNLDNKITDKLTISTSLSVNHSKDNKIDTDNGGLNASRSMLEMFPFLPVKYENGVYANSADHPGGEGTDNPVAILKEIKDEYTITRSLGNIFAEYELVPGLKLKISGGTDINYVKRNFFTPRTLRRARSIRGNASVSTFRDVSWQNENTLSYQKKFNDRHELNAVAGVTWQHFRQESMSASTTGFDDFFKYNNLGAGDTPRPPASDTYEWALNSYLGRINYILHNKYLFTLTARADGSSKFGARNKYGFFPSGAFAWRVSDEDFMKGQTLFHDLKLRTSYGITGNQETGVYRSLASLATYTYILGGQRANGLGPGRVANPDLKWEKTSQVDAGIDMGFLQNKITFTADAYYKITSDLLLNAPLPLTTGYGSIFRNIGRVENKGIEFLLSTVNFNKGFEWITDANISFNKNKVLELGPEGDDIFPGPNFVTETNILRVGQPIGSLWGWTRQGIFQDEEEIKKHGAQPNAKPGDIRYKDINNDGVINSKDQSIIGNTTPKYIFGFTNTFSYKNVSFILELQGVQGNDVLNLNPIVLEDRQTQANSYATVLDRWTPTNPSNTIAKVRKSSDLRLSTRHVEDGSYIRGKNISLGYQLNPGKLSWINGAKVYVSAQNFFLISKYGGYDPEVSTYGGNFGQGIEFSSYPRPRTFTVGVNASF